MWRPHRQRRRFSGAERRSDTTSQHAGRPVTLEKWGIATAVLTAFRKICKLRPFLDWLTTPCFGHYESQVFWEVKTDDD
jgi:hypothetical protein